VKTKYDAEVKFKVVLDENEAEKSISNLSKKTDELSKKFTNAGKKLTLGLTVPITGLITAGINYNATMETFSANLTTLLNGNQQEADKLLNSLKEMANTTPFETTALVKATQTMLGFGIEVDKSQKYLKQLGDISMGDAQKLESLTLAFSQVSSAGKLSGQDLLQMINSGFNPLNIISQKTGESMASLKERMGEGALSAEEVAQALEWATEEGGLFYGAMDKASQTTQGKLSTLKDEFNSAVGELTTGLLPVFTKLIDKLTEMARWFSNLSPQQKDFVVKMGLILAAIGPVVTIIGKLISVGSKIKTIVTLIKSWNLVTKAMTVAQKALNLVMETNKIALVISGITALISAIVLLWNNCEWFRDGVMVVINAIVGFFQGAIDFVVGLFNSIIDFVKNNWQSLLLFLVNPFAGAFKLIYDNCEGFRNIVNNILETIKNAFSKAFETIKNTISNIWNSILALFSKGGKIFSGVVDGVANVFKTIVNAIISGINKVIAVPFDVINGLLNKIRNISILGVAPFKGLWKQNPLPVPQIPKLEVGTNYVAQEGLAYLHEGEAVVPKKYNPAIGGYGNGLLKVENSNVITLQVDKRVLAEIVNNYNTEREVAV